MEDYILNDDQLELPVIPLRGLVVFPDMVLHFDVGRKKSVAALKSAMGTNQKIFIVSQKDASVDDPGLEDMFEIGVVCTIRQMIKIPGSDNLRVVVEGNQRAALMALTRVKPFLSCVVDLLEDTPCSVSSDEEHAYQRAVKKEFENYAEMVPKISSEVISKVISLKDSGEMADFICSNTFFEYTDKQQILSCLSPIERLRKLLVLLKKENSTLQIENEIHEKVQEEIDKNQREYYLREEMRVISETLGDSDNPADEADRYRERIEKSGCSSEVAEHLLKECDKLMKMPQGSHEATVVRNYLDKCLELPFGVYTKDSVNLQNARKILDKDHYGLEKVKDRIVESLAVLRRNPSFSGQIICLVGPPGVGKTSIVKSLAKAMNRKYVRVALGGVHDEAEIRGHRKTYIGAMPGRIIEAIIKSGSFNPIVLLDEIDKIGNDYKGDPSSALLEALDPEQNSTFTDHYIEFPVDLSKVLFITTANDASTISAPLYDRMEVIELTSYTAVEKFHIAKSHLVKKEMQKHALSGREFRISDDAIDEMIEHYTREAGVRQLEKTIGTLCRKATVALESGSKSFRVTKKNISEYLGVPKYSYDIIPKENLIGTVNGLAWTSVGGTMLPIEVSVFDGTGKIEITGNLGDVMTESAKTAVGYIRSRVDDYGVQSDFYKTKDIHIHAPEAAIPKDGPSAGLAITTALLSELCQIPIRCDVAMTGEISLKGRALPIGGLKEKSMAAYKAGCTTVIIPKDNEKDLQEISDEVKCGVKFVTAEKFDDIIPVALVSAPTPSSKKNDAKHRIPSGSSCEGTAVAQ